MATAVPSQAPYAVHPNKAANETSPWSNCGLFDVVVFKPTANAWNAPRAEGWVGTALKAGKVFGTFLVNLVASATITAGTNGLGLLYMSIMLLLGNGGPCP